MLESQFVTEFRESKCFACPYCQEKGVTNPDNLDIRNSGITKIWCYAAGITGDVIPIMMLPASEECLIKQIFEAEPNPA